MEDEDFDIDNEFEEPDAYECICCGSFQERITGFGCESCGSYELTPIYL